MKSVYEEILEWSQSKGIPAWWRDCLRRLVASDLVESDFTDLEILCLSEQELRISGIETPESVPLAAEHIPASTSTVGNVALQTVSDVHNVNLISGAAKLAFGDTGMTVVFGYNGSGKSGYVRILKRICRARDGGAPICPNVFVENDGSDATANLSYLVGGASVTDTWTNDGKSSIAALGRVSIFDSHCAEFYVTKENDIAYRPFGLDLFDRLASAADLIAAKLSERKSKLIPACPEPPELIKQSKLLEGLHPAASGTKHAVVDGFKPLTPEEMVELETLKRLTAEENPSKRAAALRAKKGLLLRAVKTVQDILSIANLKTVEQFKLDFDAQLTALSESELVSEVAFSELLPGTGGEPWKALWEHARRFAQIAYPEGEFPLTDQDAICVLCQQPLSPEASDRFQSFESFVKAAAATKLKVA